MEKNRMDEELFIKSKEKTFVSFLNDLDLNKLPKLDSDDKYKAVLLGFPLDEGTRIIGGRSGAERGPVVFRDCLKSTELYPFEKIDKISVYDAGNVCNILTELELTMEKAHQRLEERVTQILKNDAKTVPFVIGGSNDQSYPNAKGLLNTLQPNQKIALINIDSHFDVRDLIDGRAHSGSPFRLVLEDETFQKSNSKLVEFANQGSQCSVDHFEYLKKNKADVYWLDKDIRRSPKDNKKTDVWTQAGTVMASILDSLSAEYDAIFFSFDVDSISSAYCPGVSSPSVVGGLTDEEAAELVYLAGKCSKVRLVDMSEFNPAVEKKRTGVLLVHLFYHFCRGLADRG